MIFIVISFRRMTIIFCLVDRDNLIGMLFIMKKNNAHSFYFENRKITLFPLTRADRSRPSNSKPTMFLSCSHFETELHSLSLVVYGCIPCCSLDLTTLSNHTRLSGKAIDFITDLQCIHKLTYDHLVASVAKYKITMDCHCHHIEFDVGDKV